MAIAVVVLVASVKESPGGWRAISEMPGGWRAISGIVISSPYVVGFCVAWFLSIIVANLDGYSTRRRVLFVVTGPALVLPPSLVYALRKGYPLEMILPLWVYAGGFVVIVAGIYALPAYYVRKSFTNA